MSKEFREGYHFFCENAGTWESAMSSEAYISGVNEGIAKLINDLNSFEGNGRIVDKLKGNIAEFWHAGTFNIKATINRSKHRATVPAENGYGSVDIRTNFGHNYGLKYFSNGAASAKAQAKSIFEKYKESGEKIPFEEYLRRRGYQDESVLNDPLYKGQIRIIPKDQMETAIDWLEKKIRKEEASRPEQADRYRETLKMLQDRIKDNEGNESIPLSNEEAEKIARLAKKGEADAKALGLTTEELMDYTDVIHQSLEAGLSAAMISMVLQTAPEVFKAVEQLLRDGEIDERHFQRIGFTALSAGSEAYIRGVIAASVVGSCKAGFLGQGLKNVNPSAVAAVTVIAMDTVKNAFMVSAGKMSRQRMADHLVRDMFVTSCSLVMGGFTQGILVEMPGFGYMLGSFVGSMIGSFAYSNAKHIALSFFKDTGIAFFGEVEQDYTLPRDVMEDIGLKLFDYEKFEYEKFEYEKFPFERFEFETFSPEMLDIHFLKRGVIGVSQIGFVS